MKLKALSRLGLGTVGFGRSAGLKYPQPVVRPSDAQLRKLLSTARQLGINLLDTATAYGDGQQRLGQLTAGDPHWFIMTKVGERFSEVREDNEEGSPDAAGSRGQSSHDFSPTALNEDLQKAQDALRRPQLDAVLLHSSGVEETELMHGDALATLKTAQRAGQIRFIGASLKTTAGIEAAWQEEVDLLMLTLNSRDRELAPWIKTSAARGIAVVIKKPLASGTANADSLRWLATQSGITSVISGTLNPMHLQANARLLGVAGR